MSETLAENPTAVDSFLSRLSTVQEKDLPSFLQEQAKQLTRSQLQELDSRVREQANLPDFLKQQVYRDAVLEFTSSNLSSFREQVNAFVDGLPLPSKQTVVTGGLAVGGTLVAGGFLFLLSKLFKKGKAAKDAAVEKAKKGLSLFSKILLIVGAGVIGTAALYVGYEKAGDYFSSLADGAMKDIKEGADKKVAEVTEAAEAKIKSVTEAADAKLIETQKSLKDAQQKTTNLTSEVTEKAGIAVAGTLDAVASQEGKQIRMNLAGDVLQKMINVKAPAVYESMIDSKWTVADVQDLYDPETKGLKDTNDARILALITDGTQEEERPLYVEATRKLVVLMAQSVQFGDVTPETPIADIAEKMLQKHQKVVAILDQMKQGDYTEIDMEAFFGEIRGESSRLRDPLNNSMPSDFQLPDELAHLSLWTINQTMITAMNKNDITRHYLKRETSNLDGLKSNIETKKDEEKAQEKNFADALTQWQTLDATQNSVPDSTAQAERETEKQRLQEQVSIAKRARETAEVKLALVYILDYVSKSGEKLVPLFHRVLPDQEFNTERTPQAKQENIDAVNRYLSGSDIGHMFRFFEYRCLMENKENPMEQVEGLMFQQSEIFQLIGSRDTGDKGWESLFGMLSLKLKMKTAIANLGTDVLTNSGEFSPALASLGLTAVAIDQAYKTLGDPALELGKGTLKRFAAPAIHAWEALVVFKDSLPTEVKIPLLGAGSILAARKVSPIVNAFHSFFTKSRPERAVHAMSEISKHWGFSKSTVTFTLSALSKQDVDRGLELLKKLQQSSAESGGRGLEILEDWMKSGGGNQANVQSRLIAPLQAEMSAVQAEVQFAVRNVTDPHLCDDILKGTIATESDARRIALTLGQSPDDAVSLLQAVQRESRYSAFLRDADALLDPSNTNAVRSIARTVRSVRESAKQFYLVRHMREAGLGKSLFWLGGTALAGYDSYSEFSKYFDLKKQKKEAISTIQNHMDTMVAELKKSGSYEEKAVSDGGSRRIFVHKKTGVEVDLRIPENAFDALETVYDDRQNASLVRGTTSALSAASLFFMGAKTAAGPIGLAVAGVEVTVRFGIAAIEQDNMREFILTAPPWLLASLGTQPTGEDEHTWLQRSSSWMISDIWDNREANVTEKEEMTKRMIFSILMTDLRSAAPQILFEIAGNQSAMEMEQFYKGDFQNVFLQLVSKALFAQTDMSKENAETIDISSGLLAPARATMMDMQRATRTAAALYQELLHTKQCHHLQTELTKDIAAADSDEMRDTLQEILQELGERKVFGKAFSEVALAGHSAEKQITVESLLKSMTADTSTGIPTSYFTLAGVAAFLETPEERSALLNGIAVSPQEQGTNTEIQKSVQANPSALSQFAKQETGLSIVNGMRALLGEPVLEFPMTDAGYAHYISSEVPKILHVGTVTLDQARSSAEGPLVYTDVQANRVIDQFTVAPDSRGSAGYYLSLAVCHQGRVLGGQPYALTTFINGDPKTWDTSHPDLRITQSACAGGSRQSEADREKIHTGYIRGDDVTVSIENFLKQEGAKELLTRIKNDWTNKKTKAQEAIEAEAKRQENARERSETETGKFVEVSNKLGDKRDHELRMQFHGNTIIYRPKSIPQIVSAAGGSPWGFHLPQEHRAFRFEVVYPDGRPSETYVLNDIRQLATETSGDPKDKEIWYDLLSTPNESDVAEAIDRILNISPLRNESSGEPKFIIPAFKKVVLPMYEKCRNKKGFLRILIRGIAENGEVNRELLLSLPKMLQQVP